MSIINILRRRIGAARPQAQRSTLGLDPFEPWVENHGRQTALESFEGLALRRAFFG